MSQGKTWEWPRRTDPDVGSGIVELGENIPHKVGTTELRKSTEETTISQDAFRG